MRDWFDMFINNLRDLFLFMIMLIILIGGVLFGLRIVELSFGISTLLGICSVILLPIVICAIVSLLEYWF